MQRIGVRAPGDDGQPQPCLRMAVLGFGGDVRLVQALEERRVLLPWQASGPDEADAIWIRGTAATALGAGLVAVADLALGSGVVVVDLRSRGRPTFFSVPVIDTALDTTHTFDVASPASIDYAFRQAEALLRPRAMELLLAQELEARLPELRAERYELTRRGKLVALVDRAGAVAVNPRATVDDLGLALWRPLRQARAAPDNFHGGAVEELLARYRERVNAAPSAPSCAPAAVRPAA